MDLTVAGGARDVDGLAPHSVGRPADAGEAAAAIRAAHDAHEAVVLWSGGTRVGVGDAPARYDVALDLTAIAGVVEHSPADLVCTVRAGTTLAELAAALAPSRQRWPVDAPEPERATVGGTIASAAAAPSRLRFQHPRDWVIGCEAVLGDGTRARAGGRVVKNVSGFDLSRLYSGTYGTLAALVEVSLKLVAADEAARVVELRDADVARLVRLSTQLHEALPAEGIVLGVSDAGGVLAVRVAGGAAAVDRMARELARAGVAADATEAAWRELTGAPARETLVARCATAPGGEHEVIGGSGLAFVGTGVAYRFGASVDELRDLRARCEARGGALVLERAPAGVRHALGTWGTPRIPIAIARALKDRFDPRGVLAPGRMPA